MGWKLKHQLMEIGQERFEISLHRLGWDFTQEHPDSEARKKKLWKPLEQCVGIHFTLLRRVYIATRYQIGRAKLSKH
jgi:hypothetical protein